MGATMIYILYHILILNAFTVKYIYMFLHPLYGSSNWYSDVTSDVAVVALVIAVAHT